MKFLEGMLEYSRFGFLPFLLNHLAFVFCCLQIPQTCQCQLLSQCVSTEVPSLSTEVSQFHFPLDVTREITYLFELKMQAFWRSFLFKQIGLFIFFWEGFQIEWFWKVLKSFDCASAYLVRRLMNYHWTEGNLKQKQPWRAKWKLKAENQ